MSTDNLDWSFNRKILHVPKNLNRVLVCDHPLRPNVISVTESRITRRGYGGSTTASTGSSTPIRTPSLDPLTSGLNGDDPLSQFARAAQDPLSEMAEEMKWQDVDDSRTRKKSREMFPEDSIEPWSNRRAAILAKYTTSEKLSIVTSFLSGGEKVVVKAQSSTVDKVKTRLEQLDEFEEGSVRHEDDLSQQEYTVRIEQLNTELVSAWKGDQKVRALKIAIQCAKLLADTSVMSFYPSKFVLITDILDIFGKLVYERLRIKAEYYLPGSKISKPLPENFTPDMVLESAKETCRNWFYKIASIRELVPRLYIEMAILKSYSFLTSSEFSAALMRLTHMIRGIGHPIVAVYARCYLCRVGMLVSTPNTDRRYLSENFRDFLASYNQVLSNGIRAECQRQKMDISAYFSLYPPALDWILQAASATSQAAPLLDQLLEQAQKLNNSGLLLNTIMASFKPNLVAERAPQFVEMITKCNNESFPPYVLFRTLGLCLAITPPPQEYRRPVLNNVWKIVSTLSNSDHYIHCAEVWVQYAVANFSSREVNTFLGDIIKNMTPNRAYENYYPQLQIILEKVVNHTQDFESLLMMNNFLPLLDLFQKENIRVEACRIIITAFSNQDLIVSDPIVINALMFVCRVLHDSVNALTVDDERRQIGNLLTNFVKRIHYGRDFEQQLNFYVEARAAFTNLDPVLAQLVQCVNRLSVDTRRIVKGNHTRKTAAFVRACAAYCYITIPSIISAFTRMDLYLLSGQVALLNQCLGQADACFKAVLSLIADIPRTLDVDGKQCSTDQYLISYLRNFLSTLLVVPDSPEQSTLYLLRSLLGILQNYAWGPNSSARAYVFLQVLDLIAVASRETYPYHIDKIDSNDSLYGSDLKFIEELNKIATLIVDDLLVHLKYLGEQNEYRTQSNIAVALSVRIILRADLNNMRLATLAFNLWQLAQKHKQFDAKYMTRTLEYLKERSNKDDNEILKAVVSKLKIVNH